LVTITRSDLNDQYQLPQSCHSIADFAYEHTETFGKWKEESNSIICLSAKSQEHLLKLYEKYSRLTQATIFFEPDVDEYTSLCLYGTPEIRKALSHLPLSLKQKTNEQVVD
jgi:hypothetical protein